MRVVHDPADLPAALAGASLALGNFDGVHRGHQAVLTTAIDIAQGNGTASGAMVFEPHPRQFFNPDVPLFRLTSEQTKLELFAALGLDFTVVMRFNAALAQTRAGAFVEEYLVRQLAITHAVAGFDFQFGKGREGTPEFLTRAGKEHGFGVTVVERVTGAEGTVSSSAIRRHLEVGEVEQAARFLGYRWFVRGEVEEGDKRGRNLGFPTANLALPEATRLRYGIYAVRVRRGTGEGAPVHDAVASFGVRPTFGGGRPLLEVFIFDFFGDLYGETIEVEFVGFIRPEAKFDSVEALVERMNEDAAEARRLLAAAPSRDSRLDAALGFTRR
ncbi:MAG TPA: bifunctional riboflavin kinase/FAD synthetase [Hyphomicrobiales bacterium]|nr:bifunctional riboflavin kinase/FAD synthetase [Hyphomicrobiales bacterium]